MFERTKCPSPPPAVFPRAWREGPGLGRFQAGVVQGLELTAASERTVPSVGKMLSKSSLKIVLAGIFQFDIPSVLYDQGQPRAKPSAPLTGASGGIPPSVGPQFVVPAASKPCRHLIQGKIRLLSSCLASPWLHCSAFSSQGRGWGMVFWGRRQKLWLQGNVDTAYTYLRYPWPCRPGLAKLACEPPGAAQVARRQRTYTKHLLMAHPPVPGTEPHCGASRLSEKNCGTVADMLASLCLAPSAAFNNSSPPCSGAAPLLHQHLPSSSQVMPT